jgi:Flp pilus assembly protein TadG
MWSDFARAIRSLWHDREGAALLETIVVVPVVFMLTFGVFEFAWVFYTHQLVSAGLRDAARYAARAADNPCNSTVVTDAQNLAATGTTDGSGNTRVAGWAAADVHIDCASISNSAGTYRGGTNIIIVTASTSYTESSLGFFPYLGLSAPTISVSHSERALPDYPPVPSS